MEILTLVLAGGRGDRLRPLTESRAKPVVPFAGRRVIDFTLANCARSAIREVVIVTQYQAESVHRHLRRAWRARFDVLATFSSAEIPGEFRGTADAVRALLARNRLCRRLLVLAGDHVYRMDYRRLLADHEAARAAGTIAVLPVPRSEGRRFGVLAVGDEGIVEAFLEKPDVPPGMPERPDLSLASMGIYVFERDPLERFLAEHPRAHDFGHDVIPGMLAAGRRLAVHDFRGGECCYWRDIGDLDSYHGALMDLVTGHFDPGPDGGVAGAPAIPARFTRGPGGGAAGVARDSWVGPGTVVAGGVVDTSVLGFGVFVDHHAEVVESVLLDGVSIGAHARLRRVIVGEGVRVPAGALLGFGRDDTPGTHVTAGGLVYVGPAPVETVRPAAERAPSEEIEAPPPS